MNREKKEKDEIVDPFDLMDAIDDDLGAETPKSPAQETQAQRGPRRGDRHADRRAGPVKQGRAFFVSSTDTGVGKTTAVKVLATLLREQGLSVGVMKPVQCGGEDAKSLKEFLQLTEPLEEINPYFAKEPLSPHLAFRRERIQVHRDKIISVFQRLRRRHDILLVEGAGGLLVPIRDDYRVLDLVKDLDIDLLLVSRLGLGTINHTLLSVEAARSAGVNVAGVVFSQSQQGEHGVPEKTNPGAVSRLGKVAVLGTIPFLAEVSTDAIIKTCKTKISLRPFVSQPAAKDTGRLIADDKKYVWHPFTQMKDWLQSDPLVIEKAKGCYLFDTQGRRYLDGVSSLWVTVHGHGHPKMIELVEQRMRDLDHSTLLGLTNTAAVELAKRLVQVAPKGLEKVFYSDNGSTSVEVALKMAYQYWQNTGRPQKAKIVHLSNSYHGDTLGSVSVGGMELFHSVYSRLTFPTLQWDFPDGYRRDNYEQSLAQLETLLQTSGQEIAALIVEPLVQGAAGMFVWPDGVLKRVKDLCEKHEVFLIADEVATGFGRTGKMFACEHENVTPDFLCLAKGLTGGVLPLAATLTTQKVFDGFVFDYKEQKAFFHGHTYTGNPVACGAALANLEIFRHEHTLAKLAPKIKFLGEKLKMFYNLAHVGQVRHKGFMVGIELVKNKDTKEPFAWDEQIGVKVCQKVRERGVILRPLGNVIVLMPPLSISARELDHLLRVTYWAIRAVTGVSTAAGQEPR